MPVLLLRRRVAKNGSTEDAELLAAIDGDLSDDATLAEVVAALGAHSVVDETAALAQAWAARAAEAIAPLPDGDVKASLASFADALVERTA